MPFHYPAGSRVIFEEYLRAGPTSNLNLIFYQSRSLNLPSLSFLNGCGTKVGIASWLDGATVHVGLFRRRRKQLAFVSKRVLAPERLSRAFRMLCHAKDMPLISCDVLLKLKLSRNSRERQARRYLPRAPCSFVPECGFSTVNPNGDGLGDLRMVPLIPRAAASARTNKYPPLRNDSKTHQPTTRDGRGVRCRIRPVGSVSLRQGPDPILRPGPLQRRSVHV